MRNRPFPTPRPHLPPSHPTLFQPRPLHLRSTPRGPNPLRRLLSRLTWRAERK